MKKNNLFLLAGLTAMLTGCFGTRYTSELVSTENNTSIEAKQTISLYKWNLGKLSGGVAIGLSGLWALVLVV